MTVPFVADAGRETSETTFEWPCGCIVHSFEGELNVHACCAEHDEPLEAYTLPVVLATNPDAEIETR